MRTSFRYGRFPRRAGKEQNISHRLRHCGRADKHTQKRPKNRRPNRAVEGKAKTSRCGTMTLERLALLSVFACASAFAPAAPGALRPRNCEPLRTVTAANRGTLSNRFHKACAVRASVAATVPGCAEWREGVYWEWRGMKVRYAVMNPQGQKAPLLLVHGGFLGKVV